MECIEKFDTDELINELKRRQGVNYLEISSENDFEIYDLDGIQEDPDPIEDGKGPVTIIVINEG
jgi:hypothetical protein